MAGPRQLRRTAACELAPGANRQCGAPHLEKSRASLGRRMVVWHVSLLRVRSFAAATTFASLDWSVRHASCDVAPL